VVAFFHSNDLLNSKNGQIICPIGYFLLKMSNEGLNQINGQELQLLKTTLMTISKEFFRFI